jgi:hypothetical protein
VVSNRPGFSLRDLSIETVPRESSQRRSFDGANGLTFIGDGRAVAKGLPNSSFPE